MVMDVYSVYVLLLLVAVGILIPVIVLTIRSRRIRNLLTESELMQVGKLLFVIAAVILMVALHVSTNIPAGQLIYGRF
jgi:ABC-type cobalamin transport system permease subunit